MKLFHLLLAAGLCSFSAASAQTTPAPTPASPGTATPSTVPSGTAPVASDPKGAVTPSQIFTKGAPRSSNMNDQGTMKRRKNKDKMSDNSGKMKAKM